jgi:hypothetical protein
MTKARIKSILACVAAALLVAAVPAVAKPHPDKPGKSVKGGKGQSKPANYNFKGTYNADTTLTVTKGNSRVRKGGFIGESVAFDYGSARFRVADTNADGVQDITDVQTGDRVMVKAKLPKGDPGTPPFAASKVVDHSNPATED